MSIRDMERDLQAAIAAISLASFAAGSAGTYFVLHKKLSTKFQAEYDARLEKELKDTKRFYEKVHKTGGFADPEKLVEELGLETPKVSEPVEEDPKMTEALDALRKYTSDPSAAETTVELHNIFRESVRVDPTEEDDEEPDDPTVPYIISKDTYLEGEKDYEQSSYVYYMEDGVLTDEFDKVIEDEDKIVGEGNLHRFGYKSEDNNVVYIRNDRMEMDFEIMRSRGSYAKEVLGFTHAETSGRPRKFRSDFE